MSFYAVPWKYGNFSYCLDSNIGSIVFGVSKELSMEAGNSKRGFRTTHEPPNYESITSNHALHNQVNITGIIQ